MDEKAEWTRGQGEGLSEGATRRRAREGEIKRRNERMPGDEGFYTGRFGLPEDGKWKY